MNLRVVMPFSRPEHADLYTRHLRDEGVIWHPIVEHGTAMFPKVELVQERDWIKPLVTGKVPDGENPCYWKLNQFIEKGTTTLPCGWAHDYFTFMTDDNWWRLGFWAGLKRHAVANKRSIILCSHLRPGQLFKASKDLMRVLLFDLSMLTVRGDVLREMRFETRCWFADGMMAEQLAAKYPDGVDAADECWLYYNALRPSFWHYPESTVLA